MAGRVESARSTRPGPPYTAGPGQRPPGRKDVTVQASRLLVTLMAILILLAAVALEIDRQSRGAVGGASRQVAGAPTR
jgi:hypothetical protein